MNETALRCGFAGVTITIGSGGTANAGAVGSNGGTSSFGELNSSPGGPGSETGPSSDDNASGGNGNLSGLPSGANIEFQNGGIAQPSVVVASGQLSYGGPSRFGPGSVGTPVNGGAPSFGAGGGGAVGSGNTLTLTVGGAKSGILIVYEKS